MSTRALRTSLALALGAAAAGTILAATIAPRAGGVLLLAGWIATTAAMHQLARRGPA